MSSLTTEEKARITTLAAGGWSPTKVAAAIGRSRHAVRNALAEPEIQRAVKDEKAELAEMFKTQARAIVASIDQETIDKANLLQRMTSAGIATDKALLLTGEPTNILGVQMLVQLTVELRHQRDAQKTLPALLQTTGHGAGTPTQRAGCMCAQCSPGRLSRRNGGT